MGYSQGVADQLKTTNDRAAKADEERKAGMLARQQQKLGTFSMPTYDPAAFVTFPKDQPQQQSSGGSVVCTKFYKLGYCDKELYHAEHAWGKAMFIKDPFNQHGYYWWGQPLARQMDKHTFKGRLVIKFLYPWFMATALENARKHGVVRERTFMQKWVGKATVFLILTHGNSLLGRIRSAFFTPLYENHYARA